MEKEIRIPIPEGMEIDKENSTFECIKFKPIEKKRWRDDENAQFNGYFLESGTVKFARLQWNILNAFDVFATEPQAKSALAMARISQIMANDERFGGVITDEEWRNGCNMRKYVIIREGDHLAKDYYFTYYHFLAFHTKEQRDLFLKENEDLVRDYLMID